MQAWTSRAVGVAAEGRWDDMMGVPFAGARGVPPGGKCHVSWVSVSRPRHATRISGEKGPGGGGAGTVHVPRPAGGRRYTTLGRRAEVRPVADDFFQTTRLQELQAR